MVEGDGEDEGLDRQVDRVLVCGFFGENIKSGVGFRKFIEGG